MFRFSSTFLVHVKHQLLLCQTYCLYRVKLFGRFSSSNLLIVSRCLLICSSPGLNFFFLISGQLAEAQKGLITIHFKIFLVH